MDLTELNKKFDTYIKLKYTSKRTIESYQNCFYKFISENSRIYRLSKKDLKQYFIRFSEVYSTSYFNQMLATLRIVYKILNQPQKLNGISFRKDHPKEIQILTIDEIKKSLLLIDNIKHRCIINLLFIGGLRVSELQNIKIADVDSKKKRIFINRGKGGKSRYFPIDERDIKELRVYYQKHRPQTYLFENPHSNNKYSTSSIRNVVKKIKTNKHVYPHLLRHTALTELINKGHSILKVQQFAGHSTPKSTQRYYHMSDKALEDMTITLKESA